MYYFYEHFTWFITCSLSLWTGTQYRGHVVVRKAHWDQQGSRGVLKVPLTFWAYIMDFFDDPSLFGGGLEGLGEDGFPSAQSLVDELNLSSDYGPLQMEPLGSGKHQGIMPQVSAQQIPTYSQQMGHYTSIKAQSHTEHAFSEHGVTGGSIMPEHRGQYHNASVSQVPSSNGGFCSSPMWSNQEQNGNRYHPMSHQQQHLQQQLCHLPSPQHIPQANVRQQHLRQQQHHPYHQQQQQQQQHSMRQQLQQQSHQHQLINQHQPQHLNAQTISLHQQQHHNFSPHKGSRPESQQQIHYGRQEVQHHLTAGGPRLQSGVLPSRPYLDNHNTSLGGICSQPYQQQHANYHMAAGSQAFPGSGLEDPNLPFPMHSSSMVSSLPTCSVSSATPYQPTQYPAYPGEPEIPSLDPQSLSSTSLSGCISTNSVPQASTVPDPFGCQFSSKRIMNQQHTRIAVGQADCPFQAVHCSGETQEKSRPVEMFGKSMSCYPNMTNQLSTEQSQSHGVINSNRYQDLKDSLLTSEAQDGGFEGLEPPDLLPDLLPQLEAALKQESESSCSWACSMERGDDAKKPTPFECKDEKVMVHICFNHTVGDTIFETKQLEQTTLRIWLFLDKHTTKSAHANNSVMMLDRICACLVQKSNGGAGGRWRPST